MPALEERANKVGRWAAAVGSLLDDAAARAASGASGVPIDEATRLHAEALRLRVKGARWEALLAAFASLRDGVEEVRTSLVHHVSAAAVADAIAVTRSSGIF